MIKNIEDVQKMSKDNMGATPASRFSTKRTNKLASDIDQPPGQQ